MYLIRGGLFIYIMVSLAAVLNFYFFYARELNTFPDAQDTGCEAGECGVGEIDRIEIEDVPVAFLIGNAHFNLRAIVQGYQLAVLISA